MPNNHVQFRHGTKPSLEQLHDILDEMGHIQPKPIVKINIAVKDCPHASLEALFEFMAEHEIAFGVTTTAVFDEGQSLKWWTTNQPRLTAHC